MSLSIALTFRGAGGRQLMDAHADTGASRNDVRVYGGAHAHFPQKHRSLSLSLARAISFSLPLSQNTNRARLPQRLISSPADTSGLRPHTQVA
jgi:hypothetical protein